MFFVCFTIIFLQCYTVLEYGYFPVSGDFVAGSFTGTDCQHIIKKFVCQNIGIGAGSGDDKAVEAIGEKVDFAVNIDVPDEAIITRMSGRRACLTCGATYHIEYNPPKKADICDTCGSALVLREDDKPETVKTRLNVYHEQTQPLIDYYTGKNILVTVDGTQNMDKVFSDIKALLGE